MGNSVPLVICNSTSSTASFPWSSFGSSLLGWTSDCRNPVEAHSLLLPLPLNSQCTHTHTTIPIYVSLLLFLSPLPYPPLGSPNSVGGKPPVALLMFCLLIWSFVSFPLLWHSLKTSYKVCVHWWASQEITLKYCSPRPGGNQLHIYASADNTDC